MINNKGNLEDHIKVIEGKTEAAYQTILYIAKDENFKGIKMETIWKLIETCILPILLYGAEVRETTKKEKEKLQTIMNNILKRTLKLPQSTPSDAVLIEAGFRDIQTLTNIKKLIYILRIESFEDNRREKIIIGKRTTWTGKKADLVARWELEDDLKKDKSIGWKKRQIKRAAGEELRKEIEERNIHTTKNKFYLDNKEEWQIGNRAPYLQNLSRKEASTIIKARTRMLRVKKNNIDGKQPNNTCRACGKEEETQEHVLEECPALITDEGSKITPAQIFNEDADHLKTLAEKLDTRIKELENTINPVSGQGQGNSRGK